jgi:hypothetical protein
VNIIAVTSATPVNVTVQTSSAVAEVNSGVGRGLVALVAGLVLLPIGWRRRRWITVALVIAAVALLTAANGCGSGGSGGGGSRSPVTSTLTVSATGTGLTTATETLTLTVQ